MGSLPGITVGMGATEEVAERREEAELLSILGSMIMMAVMSGMGWRKVLAILDAEVPL
jgi:hypothetical protein